MSNTKTVLVTGASRGIGRAIALKFASKGYNLAINCSNSRNDLYELSEYINNTFNVKCIPVVADVSNYSQVLQMFNVFFTHFSTIDVLVNNAGIANYELLMDLSPDNWHKIINTNLSSIYNTCHFAIPKMLSNDSGNIINISSIWGEIGASCEVAYSASKGGMNSFTKALAKELAPSGIRINAISAGAFDTDMNSVLCDNEKNEFIKQIPLNRFGNLDEIASLCEFIACDQSKYITGQIITIDGGLS